MVLQGLSFLKKIWFELSRLNRITQRHQFYISPLAIFERYSPVKHFISESNNKVS